MMLRSLSRNNEEDWSGDVSEAIFEIKGLGCIRFYDSFNSNGIRV